MIKNYLLTALRNLRHNKLFSLINVLGLSIGISAALVIYLIVHYEFSFEQFRPAKDRIYRVVTDMKMSGDAIENSGVAEPLPEAIRREATGVETVTALYIGHPMVSIPAAKGKPAVFKSQKNFTFADNDYFTLFPEGYRWLAGSPKTALLQPNSTVLAQSRAALYFPGLSPDASFTTTPSRPSSPESSPICSRPPASTSKNSSPSPPSVAADPEAIKSPRNGIASTRSPNVSCNSRPRQKPHSSTHSWPPSAANMPGKKKQATERSIVSSPSPTSISIPATKPSAGRRRMLPPSTDLCSWDSSC